MYVTMMMTDQIPLELPPLLNGEVAMMPHLVNGEAAQQVRGPPSRLGVGSSRVFGLLGIHRSLLFELCCSREVFCCCTITVLFKIYLKKNLSSETLIPFY